MRYAQEVAWTQPGAVWGWEGLTNQPSGLWPAAFPTHPHCDEARGGRLSTKSSIQGGREEGSQGDAQREQSSIHLHNAPALYSDWKHRKKQRAVQRASVQNWVRTSSEWGTLSSLLQTPCLPITPLSKVSIPNPSSVLQEEWIRADPDEPKIKRGLVSTCLQLANWKPVCPLTHFFFCCSYSSSQILLNTYCMCGPIISTLDILSLNAHNNSIR